MTSNPAFRGLSAAPHTPFDHHGALCLDRVEAQAAALHEGGVRAVFVAGSTGEFASLTFDERDALTRRWIEVAPEHALQVIVHVGGTAVEAGAELARRAQGADAISALAPYYYRPADAARLVASCAALAGAASELPFYYYDIPVLTGVTLGVVDHLELLREAAPNFAGVKHTSPDLAALQQLLEDDALDVLYGNDESLLAALALGARGFVGSTYNFAPGPYLRLAQAFRAGDLETARREQLRSVHLVRVLAGFGYLGAAKATMKMLGVDVGPPRLPVAALLADREPELRTALESIGFFDWRAAPDLAAAQDELWSSLSESPAHRDC